MLWIKKNVGFQLRKDSEGLHNPQDGPYTLEVHCTVENPSNNHFKNENFFSGDSIGSGNV